jgi:hypothetical protein
MIKLAAAENSRVRIAVREDEDALMNMVREMHPEAALKTADGVPLPLDEELARSHLHRAIIPNRNSESLPAWIGLAAEGGQILGSVYLSLATLWYSRQPVLIEHWLFVARESRRSNVAASLIDFGKKSADAAKVTLVVGHMSSGREAAKGRFYRRHVGPQIGGYYAYHGATTGAL